MSCLAWTKPGPDSFSQIRTLSLQKQLIGSSLVNWWRFSKIASTNYFIPVFLAPRWSFLDLLRKLCSVAKGYLCVSLLSYLQKNNSEHFSGLNSDITKAVYLPVTAGYLDKTCIPSDKYAIPDSVPVVYLFQRVACRWKNLQTSGAGVHCLF